MMYWHIGERINRDVLGSQRAEYGKQIVAQVARQLQKEYGKKGFDDKSIRRMMQFANLFADEQIVAQAARQLSWSHFIEVLPLKDDLQREFYITMAVSGRCQRKTPHCSHGRYFSRSQSQSSVRKRRKSLTN